MHIQIKKTGPAFLLVVFFVAIGFICQAQKTLKKKDFRKLTEYYEEARAEWDVPGMAIGIVKDGEIVLAEGFGQQDIRKDSPVDSKTMFPIASNTKAFTSAALAILVDEGKIAWQDKVVDYIPWFKLYDPYVSENMTIRDLLCHRSGLATFSGDLLWYGTGYSRDEVIERARYLEPVYGFREHFGYSNILFLTAGQIIPAVTGKSWDEFVEAHFFNPLGMERTVTSTNDLGKFRNIATPHTDHQINDSVTEVIAIPYLNWDNIAPAGSIISCVDDVCQWLMLQLNRGIYNDDTIFSQARSREMWSPNTILGVSGFVERNWPSTFFRAYGLGWQLSNYHGRKIISHSGGYDGMISYTCMVPEEDLGFVILTNKNSSLYYPLIYKTLDLFLSDDGKDWSEFMLDLVNQNYERSKQTRKEWESQRIENAPPSHPIQGYTGLYGGELYGDARVEVEGDQLTLQLLPAKKFKGKLTHWHFDTFEIVFEEFPSLPPGTCTFITGPDGNVTEMKIDVPNPDFDFTELEFLKKE
nr:serine hydrolase [Bacteroidota bacterium]